MTAKFFTGGLAVFSLLLGLTTVNAKTITITSGQTVLAGPSPAGTGATFTGNVGSFTVTRAQGNDTGGTDIVDFTSTLNVSTNNPDSNLNIIFTEREITAPTGQINFISTLSALTIPAGWTVVEDTFLLQLPAATRITLKENTFRAAGSIVDNKTLDESSYLLIEDFFINPGSTKGSAILRMNILTSTAIPELSSWAMIGLGFAGLALVGRRRLGEHSKSCVRHPIGSP